MKRAFLFVLLLASSLAPHACFAEIKSATIYHVSFGTMTCVSMSEEDVRRIGMLKIEVTDELFARRLVSTLDVEKMQEGRPDGISDLRLVIDVLNDDGSIITYLANRFEIGLKGSTKKRSIDAGFRSRYDALFEIFRGAAK